MPATHQSLALLVLIVGCGQSLSRADRTILPAPAHDYRELHAYLDSTTHCIKRVSGIDATIEILDEPSVAAYASDGGRIEISRGLLAHLRSEAELEAVTAHELAHLAAGHVAEEEREAPSSRPSGFGKLAALFEAARAASHSRAQELEADAKALEYLHACGHSAHAMAELFDVLEPHESDDEDSWFATHPSFAERRARLDRGEDEPRSDLGRTRYIEALVGLVYGDDPREGYVHGSDYLIPTLDVQIAMPSGWSNSVIDGELVGQSPMQRGMMAILRAAAGNGRQRLEAALAAGGLVSNGISELELASARVTAARFAIGNAEGALVHFERDTAALLLLAVAPSEHWSVLAGEVERTTLSFGRIEREDLRAIEPWRLAVVRLGRSATLQQVAARHPSQLDLAGLSALNGVAADAVLPAGTAVKIVVASARRSAE